MALTNLPVLKNGRTFWSSTLLSNEALSHGEIAGWAISHHLHCSLCGCGFDYCIRRKAVLFFVNGPGDGRYPKSGVYKRGLYRLIPVLQLTYFCDSCAWEGTVELEDDGLLNKLVPNLELLLDEAECNKEKVMKSLEDSMASNKMQEESKGGISSW